MDGTVFHRRDISTPGGLHHYKDESCSACKGAIKCRGCSKKTAGNKHDSKRKEIRKALYDPAAHDVEARAERHLEVYVPAARAERHLDDYDSAERAKLFQV
jgi:hypothetical protein